MIHIFINLLAWQQEQQKGTLTVILRCLSVLILKYTEEFDTWDVDAFLVFLEWN